MSTLLSEGETSVIAVNQWLVGWWVDAGGGRMKFSREIQTTEEKFLQAKKKTSIRR